MQQPDFLRICLEVFTKKFSEDHREMPIFENGLDPLSSKLGRLKKYIKNQCLFGVFCLKIFIDKDFQGFFNSFEISSAEFNSVENFKSYGHLKIAIFVKIAFFDNFKPPPFVSTRF